MSEKETVYPEIVIIEEPEKIKLLTDPIKKAILYLLRGKTLTARQITEELKKTALFDSKNITVQKINYHLKLLENAGLVKISKEEPIPNRPHMTTRYYTRVAPLYLVRYTPDSTKMEISSKFDKDTFKRLLHSFGYKLSDDEINTLLVKVVEFERLLYDEFINFSKKQIQPSGVNPSVLAKFFKTFGLIFSMNNEKVISLIKEIKSMLDNSIKNSN